jgi:hypothetical protein
MATVTFNPITYGSVSFTNIQVNEVDSGTVAAFSSASGSDVGLASFLGGALVPTLAIDGVNAGVYGAGSSETLNLSYTVTATSGNVIDSMSQLYVADTNVGPGVSLVAVETLTNPTTGAVIGSNTFTLGATNVPTTALTQNLQAVNVSIQLTMAISATAGTSSSELLISDLQQSFGTQAAPQNTASIGDIVFLDSTGSGVESSFDSGPGVAGVTVELLNGNGTSILATTTTNSSGLYSFTGLAAGTYEVKFLSPTGYAFTQQGVGGNPAVDSSANQITGLTAPITLTAGQADHNVEAGLVQTGGTTGQGSNTASIGTVVWLDSNHDGILDNGEKGVAGVTVELLNGAGTSILATTTTNSTGNYNFTKLAAGTYEVKFLAPSGDAFTTEYVPTSGVDSVANSAGLTAPITLTAGQVDNQVNAGLVNSGAIGDLVWMDTNKDGLYDNGETGVGSVTVELLNGNGSSILATTTTNSAGNYEFTGLAAGVYEVKFLSPTGDTFTTQGVGSNPAINSSPSTSTGVTAPITLAAGQIDNNVEAGLQQTSGLSVLKIPCSVVVNQCGQETYTFYVTNTGSTALKNVNISDNIGTAANPDYVTPILVTQGTNGVLQPGQTWTYTETIAQIGCTSLSNGSVCHTASGSNLGGGSTAWFSSSFDPKSCADGATYKFQGITCTVQGSGTGGKPITISCPDSEVVFSKNCTSASTVYDSNQNCWITTLPANCNPGSVFLTGVPQQVQNGCNYSNCSVTWNIGDASNNCGATSINWDGSCTGYSSFTQNGCNGLTNYNNIGVKSCDNLSGYGNGGNCNVGYGYNGSSYSDCGYNAYGGGCGYYYSQSGWNGSSDDNCGTPENQFTSGNCGNTSTCNSSNNYSYSNCYGGNGYYGYGCGSYGGGSSNYGCGSSSGGGSGNSCGDSGSATQNCGTTSGSADTVTVTAQTVTSTNSCGTVTAAGTTVTASDTKEVEILGGNSNVSLDGSVPTGVLSSLYGSAKTLEFVYNPGNTVSLGQSQTGMASVTGSNSLNTAYMVIENAAGTQIYFEGEVTAGELIYADASLNPLTNTPIANGQFSTTAGASIVAQVFTSQAAFQGGAAATQTDTYNTSGSQAMHLGDTVGSLTLDGYIGKTGGHIVDTTATTSTLTLNMSEDAYQGDAQFTVSVNGQQVGGVMTANALHSMGDSEVFVLTGNWSTASANQVAISFINDAYGGTSSTDRNLYVNSIALNGTTYANTSATMCSSGTDTFAVGGSTGTASSPADVLTLNLSEDTYQGDAQFELFVDGKQVSTPQSVTTLNSTGGAEAFTFSGNFGTGNHTVGIAFTNDAYGGTSSTDRNLYVNSIALNGATVANSSATLDSNGTANFTIYTAH